MGLEPAHLTWICPAINCSAGMSGEGGFDQLLTQGTLEGAGDSPLQQLLARSKLGCQPPSAFPCHPEDVGMLLDHHGMQPVLARDARRWDAVVPRDGWCSAEGRLLTAPKVRSTNPWKDFCSFLEFWFLFIASQTDPQSPNHVQRRPSRKLASFPLVFVGFKTHICAGVWFFSLIVGL